MAASARAGRAKHGMHAADTARLISFRRRRGSTLACSATISNSPLIAGSLGSLLTIWVTFVPCFFWIFLGAPYTEALRENKPFSAALSAITAAVVGVVMNLALWFALHVIFGKVQSVGLGTEIPVLSSLDWRAALLSAVAMIAMLRLRIGMPPTLAGSALVGLVLLAP